ncbi:MAG: DUF2442 domain-containing protein [Muribaculaceae bacterium]|nr:DUF2442 domain-containing protein [Muribaculaceae bacterium]
MKIVEIWFDKDYIYGRDDEGNTYRQSLLWYPRLKAADEAQKAQYRFGLGGIHWRNLDEDISFESFKYEDAEPSPLQQFFLTHREINIPEFAKSIGINPSLLRNYINGFKKPSEESEQFILNQIRKLGWELSAAIF